MPDIRVTGVQMEVAPGKKENLPRILSYIERADCDFMLFPEMSLTGYNNNFNDARTRDAWDQIAAACRQHYVTAIVGTGARDGRNTYIQSRIITDEGEMLGTHEKLVPTEGDREWCLPGEELNTFEHNGIQFGCLICNDLWVTPGCGPWPDLRLSYQLGKKGAQIIFHSINSGADPLYRSWHDSNLRLRAKESGLYIATANAAVKDSEINAPSGLVSPEGEWIEKCPLSGEHTWSWDIKF
jgi:predicted amidohydrolase